MTWNRALKAKPNLAHATLATFSLPSLRHGVAPGSTFTLVTQNVDGLSTRALGHATSTAMSSDLRSPGSADHLERPYILEMHGRLFDVKCTSRSCGHSEFNTASPICESLAGTDACVGSGVLDPEIPEAVLPRCSKCNALARPGVVWFGEMPEHLDTIQDLVDEADLCLVIGTPSTASTVFIESSHNLNVIVAEVYPAAGYAGRVKEHGGKIAVFNLDHSQGDEDADFLFLGPCEETLPKALDIMI